MVGLAMGWELSMYPQVYLVPHMPTLTLDCQASLNFLTLGLASAAPPALDCPGAPWPPPWRRRPGAAAMVPTLAASCSTKTYQKRIKHIKSK